MTEALQTPPPIRTLGVVGDVHAEHQRLERALNLFAAQGVDAVICTGDIADGPGNVDTCCDLLRQAKVTTVAGNHDRWLLDDRVREIEDAHHRSELSETSEAFLTSLGKTESLTTCAGELLLCHGVDHNDLRKVWPGTERMPIERSHELDSIILRNQHRYVINGHLHYRVVVDFESLTLINAGTLCGRHRPGVSIVDFAQQTVTAYQLDDAHRDAPCVAECAIAPDESRRIWGDTQEFDGQWTPLTLY